MGIIGKPTAGQLRELVRAAVVAASDSGYARARAVRDGMAAALDEAGLGELMYRVTGFMTGSAGCSGSGWVMGAGPCRSSSISTVPHVVRGSTSPDRARWPSSYRSLLKGPHMKRHNRDDYYVVGEGILTFDTQRGPRHHPALGGGRRAQVPVLPPGTDGRSGRRCPSGDHRDSGDSNDHRSAGRRSRIRSCARLRHSVRVHLPRPVRRPRSDQGQHRGPARPGRHRRRTGPGPVAGAGPGLAVRPRPGQGPAVLRG